MTVEADMTTPVTRGELRDELQQLEARVDRKLERLDEKLEAWGGALLARIESGEQRMLAELARHAKAIQEALSTQGSAIDEKYADLPRRVRRLEAAVFEPEPR
jgi:hypothetical protein